MNQCAYKQQQFQMTIGTIRMQYIVFSGSRKYTGHIVTNPIYNKK